MGRRREGQAIALTIEEARVDAAGHRIFHVVVNNF
jgi:hypothetical protein